MEYKLTTIREIIGDVLCEQGRKNPDIYVIDSDLAKSTTTNKFQNEFPNRFVETGIAEQNAVSIATGIADEGKIPFYVNFAIFVSGTAWTQVRQACYANANVKFIATHPGMDGDYDGASHHANEDIALMRVLPNMKVLVPSNHDEFKKCVQLAIDHEVNQFIDVFFFVCNDFQFRNLSVRENFCHRNILRKFRFQIQSVAFSCYKFYFSFAAVYYFKKLINVCNILYLHDVHSFSFISSYLLHPQYIQFFFENQGFFFKSAFWAL